MPVLDLQSGEAAYEMPRLLSIKQACCILGLSRTSLYALMASEQLRSVTVGRRRFVPLEAIEEFIAGLPTEYRRSA
ncbi:MAG: helix-turn-helix domain-containing protein [Methyloceanibacter sp.]